MTAPFKWFRTRVSALMAKPSYYYILATDTHKPIKSLKDMTRWRNTLGFFFRDSDRNLIALGGADLSWENRPQKYLHTGGVALNEQFRKKGHGIHLYFALIRAAKELGAKRLYSDTRLNKHSGRMWCVKLREFFEVRGPKQPKKACRCGCRACRKRWGRYYIDLTKISLRSIPR